jgi:nicotinamide riboside kinase
MEKSFEIGLNLPRKVVITGPESAGKTVLAESLAAHYHGVCIPEYARDYIAGLKRPYTGHDVKLIAQEQINQTRNSKSKVYYFFDTWLIITKVWLEVVYNEEDNMIEEMIAGHPVDLFLVCEPDLPWFPDPVRENGGERRLELFNQYILQIRQAGYPFVTIAGFGESRLKNAIQQSIIFIIQDERID